MNAPGKASNHRQAVLLAFLRVAMTQRIWNRPRYACNYSAQLSERAITKLWVGASAAVLLLLVVTPPGTAFAAYPKGHPCVKTQVYNTVNNWEIRSTDPKKCPVSHPSTTTIRGGETWRQLPESPGTGTDAGGTVGGSSGGSGSSGGGHGGHH